MSNLFNRIEGKRGEVFTTEILGHMLENPLCLKKLLDLLGSQADPETMEVSTELCSGSGRPYITISNADEIIFVENKPWDRSSLTNGTQVRRYTDNLSGASQKTKRFCLLVKGILEGGEFLRAIADAEDGIHRFGIEEIKMNCLLEKNVSFLILTWEHLLDALGAFGPETVPRYFAEQLRGYIFPPAKNRIDELTQTIAERLNEERTPTHSKTEQRIREWCEEQQRIGTIKFREHRDGMYTVFPFKCIGTGTAPDVSGKSEENYPFAIILYDSVCWIWYPKRKFIVGGPIYDRCIPPQKFSEQLDRMFIEFQKEENSALRA